MTFGQLYGAKLDRELGTEDRTQRFTTVRRKDYANEGIAKFAEYTGCYTKRAEVALSDGTQEYDLESAGVLAAGDFLRVTETSASIRITDGSDVRYLEGDEFQYRTEEQLNATEPGWRSWAAGIPRYWYRRTAGAATSIGLVPAPDVTGSDVWVLLLPYVAVPPVLSGDNDELYEGRVALVPYHEGPLYWAAAQCEKLRKNYDGETRLMNKFAGVVAKYKADQAPPPGGAIRLRVDYRRRLRRPEITPFGR